MSDKIARIHTQPSNRARPKDPKEREREKKKEEKEKERKVVFKAVLDSPCRIQWPSVPMNLQNAALVYLLQLLEGAADHHKNRCASRKRKRAAEDATLPRPKKSKKEVKNEGASTSSNELATSAAPEATVSESESPMDVDPPLEPPKLLQHLVYGINAVTKRLEEQVQAIRHPVVASIPDASNAMTTTTSQPPLLFVFVCRADVNPSLLVDHLPHLIATYNSARAKLDYVKLVPLPPGSEVSLAKVLGIRRVSVLAVDAAFPEISRFRAMTERVPNVSAPWLSQVHAIAPFVPTHIKQLRTTAPKDMKSAKEQRTRERAAAKLAKANGKQKGDGKAKRKSVVPSSSGS